MTKTLNFSQRELVLKPPKDDEGRFEKIQDGVPKHKDRDGRLDANSLSALIVEQGLDASQTIVQLRKQGLPIDVPILAKIGVTK